MKFLVDTNVLMDVLVQRSPFDVAAAQIWSIADLKQIDACVSSISFATVYYLARRMFDRARADTAVKRVRAVFAVASVDSAVIDAAIASGLVDFEDALQAFSGRAVGATHVITRDPAGFADGPLISPEELLRSLQSKP